MKDFTESPEPTDVAQLWARLCRYVRSVPDFNFVGHELTGSADGEWVAHGGRSVPKRVFFEIVDASTPDPVVLVGDRTATHVQLFASAEMGVNAMYVF